MKKTDSKSEKKEEKEIVKTLMSKETNKKITDSKGKVNCKDKNCHIHGNLKARGRVFEGIVIRKFHKRVTIEFERMIYVRKYERYAKSRTKIHALLPTCIEEGINIGDLIQVQECRPLSKIIHHVVIKKIKSKEEIGERK